MKVSGFTIIRNAIEYDYPVLEAIRSILPLCDEFVVAVGKSSDDTLGLVQSLNDPKIKIIETVWEDQLRVGGRVLAEETDKAYRAISPDSDWGFYIQSDEAVHEKYLDTIREAMERYREYPEVEGLLFNYEHFYGSYDYVGASRKWYRREIRIVRNLPAIYSYKDAQGFRIENRKLNVKLIEASIYHYGWVKSPATQQKKQKAFNKFWHDDEWMEKNIPNVNEFDYSQIDALKLFEGTHPQVLKKRIAAMNWKFSFDPTKKNLSFKYRILHWIEHLLGWRIGEYKNYKLI